MPTAGQPRQPARTLLGELIRQRRQTAEEFSADAERHAQQHGLNATLSPRHVQRLTAGQHTNGRPLGPLRPATQRLLEHMLNRPITELLSPPHSHHPETTRKPDNNAHELRTAIATSTRIDPGLIRLFQQHLNNIRNIDRQLGAAEVHNQLHEHIAHLTTRLNYSLTPNTRHSLAATLVDAHTLAGWLALDQTQLTKAWRHYEHAKTHARETESASLLAYSLAAQAVMLLDADEYRSAEQLIQLARANMDDATPGVLLAWLHGAAGEVHAANGNYDGSMREFDLASRTVRHDEPPELPFVILSVAHLGRWRGHALTYLDHRNAIPVLNSALRVLEPTFVRAELSIRLDLAQVLAGNGDPNGALYQLDHAHRLVTQCGSLRLDSRRRHLARCVRSGDGPSR